MKILFIGDVVGSLGRDALKDYLPKLKAKYMPDVTIVNGENAAGGKGLTQKIYHEISETGADVITMGNHTWDKKEIFEFIENAPNLIRPVNFPEGNPGKGYVIHKVGKRKIAIINAQGRTFLPPIDCPFKALDELVTIIKKETPFIFVDFHAEATSEKLAMGWYLDGRVSAVVGTHTHVQTADERILPEGTAYITDVGMTGPYDGILGMDKDIIIQRFLTNLPARFEVANGREQCNGVFINVDDHSGKAIAVKRIHISEEHPLFD
ncbi:TIGR00282 family metallophosphoesterase [Salipaludibacillus agaradhaerens]|uniref:TIGR00282 family metallophosphoesterase n=1 Tax=Salipaludibacillus agaradhaerens TaxID=76935 RepID=A0A9Q4B155_SALAG|nr:TIGR00282 family metallophosphoesterase [Salipaludibacillus agaradhaerens]MCR6096117.1 TIGR00282 family metallophosphoesterase [Salipaludibacillus agaradhaerens]MCR6114324.1 TIGR00282 family metallophosphoesterase [Salipaludibacillus agaradhaerens]